MGDDGVRPDDVAALISGRASRESWPAFVVDGRDWGPVLAQCVSSELDADRMDYLLRDSYFAGVPYGRYDLEWLVDHLRAVDQDDRLYLGLESRAAFTFDDYLLSRFHMFMSVYLHHTPVGYELMLERYRADPECDLRIPSDTEAYLMLDDVSLMHTLRNSPSRWAQRLVMRRAYHRVVESRQLQVELPEEDRPLAPPGALTAEAVAAGLAQRGIDTFVHTTVGRLSKYVRRAGEAQSDPTVYVIEAGHAIPVAEYTPLYR
ncbi:MAG: phosphohydrolase, partial [Myxococcota bacterium]